MKYCNKCKVNVNHQHNTCPLCGSYLNPNDNNNNCTAYQQMDEHINRPVVPVKQKTNFLQNKVYMIMIVLCILAVAINLATSATPWSSYVIIGTVLVLFCVLFPICEGSKIQQMIRTDITVLTLCTLAFEFTITGTLSMWFAVYNILPWLFLAGIVLVDFLIIFRDFAENGLFSTLIYLTILNSTPQIIAWIQSAVEVGPYSNLSVLILFMAGLLNIIIVLIVCTNSIKEEMHSRLSI